MPGFQMGFTSGRSWAIVVYIEYDLVITLIPMTLTTDIIQAEADQLRADGVEQLPRDHGEYVRAAKAHLDCATMLQRFGPIPYGFYHAGWPWGKHLWHPDRYDPQKNVLRAAAYMVLEFERIDERNEAAIALQRTAAATAPAVEAPVVEAFTEEATDARA